MDQARLREVLAGFARARVLVVGDYFLDKYLEIDRSLAEVSIETGLEAHQVVQIRTSPGAAGTVVSNLRALQVGVVALSVIGDDGEGYDLQRGLTERDVDIEPLIRLRGRFTPTYTKPMMHEPDGRVHELSRLDIKNRQSLPPAVEGELVERLRALVPAVDGVIIADQVPERNCGIVTDRVRQVLIELAAQNPQVVVAVDSRMRIGAYRDIVLKPNDREALRAVGREHEGAITLTEAAEAGRALHARTNRPVFVTVGAQGILLCDENGCGHIPAVPVTGEIDIVGAGDSTIAGIVSALVSGATPPEAALVGNLVASVTVRCIGATGTASQAEVAEALSRWQAART
ncbi:MAG: bifunctional heptose 7-phosphate kinase/heptose 1-phosphate adenyltransferase [Anaerolineae bacterium]